MMNKSTDLNNYLFAEIERLDDDSLTDDQLHSEIDRAKAITTVATQIIKNASVALRALEIKDNLSNQNEKMPALLEDNCNA